MDASFSEWLENIRIVVAAFASLDFQRAAWRGEVATSFGSPDEMMCALFDDSEVREFLQEYSATLAPACAKAGSRLVDELERYAWPMQGQFIDALELLKQDHWRDVCYLASQFLREIELQQIGSQEQD